MKTYVVSYSKFAKVWLVINSYTRIAQSAYMDRKIAEQVMRGLNTQVRT